MKERSGGLAYALYATDGAAKPPAGYIDKSGTDYNAAGTTVLALNTWTHLATTYDGAALRLYVNGVLAKSRTLSGSIIASTGPLDIGSDAVWGEYFAGLIDDVRVYNRALSQTEIQTDMNTPVGSSQQAAQVAAPLSSLTPGTAQLSLLGSSSLEGANQTVTTDVASRMDHLKPVTPGLQMGHRTGRWEASTPGSPNSTTGSRPMPVRLASARPIVLLRGGTRRLAALRFGSLGRSYVDDLALSLIQSDGN